MKHRLATPYVLLSVSLLSTLAGCHVLVDEMIANSTMSGATDKNASNANDSRNSNRRGGRVVRPNPSGEIPIINPISDGIGGGGAPPPPPPPATDPPPPPPTTLPSSSSPLRWTGGGPTPDVYSNTSSYAQNTIVYKDGKYYKAKNATGLNPPDPTTEGNNGTAWKRVNPNGTDYLRTGQGNATPYDANTTYNDPAPPGPPQEHYYVTHNNKLWQANATGGQFSGTAPGSGGMPIRWTEITAPTTPFPLKDSLGNTLGTINGNAGNRVLNISSGTTIIRDNAFKNKNLDQVTIPPGVTAIGKGAFEGNTNLTSVTIPNSVTHIKENAFKNTDLSTVTIPNSVVSIGDNAFRNTDLSSAPLAIPTSVTSIGNGAFMDAELSSVTFSTPSSVTSIGNDAFRNTDLTSVTIPNSVISIGNGAFAGTSLTSVTFAPTSSVTSIGDDAFKNTDLTSVTIPIRVTSIGTGAFAGITTLTSVTISQTLLTPAVRTSAFPSPTLSTTITFKDHSGATIP